MKLTKKIHTFCSLFLKKSSGSPQQPLLPPKDPVYKYQDKDLTETPLSKLVPSNAIFKATLILIGCDIEYGTLQYWALAGAKKFILVDCNVTAIQLRHHLQQVTLPAAGETADSYPSIEVIGCTFVDDTFETLFVKPDKKLIFNESATSPLGAGKQDFSCVLEKLEHLPLLSTIEFMAASSCAPQRNGILYFADNSPIPPAKHLQIKENVKLTL